MLISPGALDMGGLIITPREEDFRRLTAEQAAGILREVTLTEEELQPTVERITGISRKEDEEDNAEDNTSAIPYDGKEPDGHFKIYVVQLNGNAFVLEHSPQCDSFFVSVYCYSY